MSKEPNWNVVTEAVPGAVRTVITIDDGEFYRGILRVSNGKPTSAAVQVDNGDDKPKYVNMVSWKCGTGKLRTIEEAKADLLKQMRRYAWREEATND